MSYKDQYEKANKAGEIQDLTPTFTRFEKEGDVILGKLVSYNPVQSSLGEGQYNQYLFETDDGLVKFSLGQAADSELGSQFVAGEVYRIEFLGKEKIDRGRAVNKYEVVQIPSGENPQVGGKDDIPF